MLNNPVIIFRNLGEEGLRKELNPIDIQDLKKIVKTWCPDMNGTMYRTKKKERIIDYIVMRASKLSKLGQCFRECD